MGPWGADPRCSPMRRSPWPVPHAPCPMPHAPMFRKLLIANRGEIALRVIRACHELGISSVAIYSDADAHAPHVREADEAVHVGPAPSSESYLRGEAIIAAAKQVGAAASRPGDGVVYEREWWARK